MLPNKPTRQPDLVLSTCRSRMVANRLAGGNGRGWNARRDIRAPRRPDLQNRTNLTKLRKYAISSIVRNRYRRSNLSWIMSCWPCARNISTNTSPHENPTNTITHRPPNCDPRKCIKYEYAHPCYSNVPCRKCHVLNQISIESGDRPHQRNKTIVKHNLDHTCRSRLAIDQIVANK